MNLFSITTLLFLSSKEIENSVYGAKAVWTAIATSNLYANNRVAIENDAYFETSYISKTMPQIWAKMGCAESCVADRNCRAFSFYETGEFYVCDLSSDNYCSDQTGKMLIFQPGSFVWYKLSNGSTRACLEAKIVNVKVVPIPCEGIRPGCLGNWPNCTSCVRTCSACYTRYPKAGQRSCTLWPDGDDAETSVPLISTCYDYTQIMMSRKVNVTTGEVLLDYRMSFLDMNRIEQLNQHKCMGFAFKERYGTILYAMYKTNYIDINGTLTNVTWYSGIDIMNIGYYVPKQVPFITVTNDTYGCGSFWLVNSTNATYCPGGTVRMSGTPIVNGTNVISTGIRFNDYYSFYTFVEVVLARYTTC